MKKLKYRDEITAIIAIVLFYVIMEAIGITCPILYVTGISCAGCGMSRAWLSVLHGNLSLAFYYHPLFWMAVPMALCFFFREKLSARVRKWALIVIAFLFIGVYLFRMFDLTDDIVFFDPKSGLLARGFAYILHYVQELA